MRKRGVKCKCGIKKVLLVKPSFRTEPMFYNRKVPYRTVVLVNKAFWTKWLCNKMQKTAGHINQNIIKHFRTNVFCSKTYAHQYCDKKPFVYKKLVSVLKDWFHRFHQYYGNVFYAKSLQEYVWKALYTQYNNVNNLFILRNICSV